MWRLPRAGSVGWQWLWLGLARSGPAHGVGRPQPGLACGGFAAHAPTPPRAGGSRPITLQRGQGLVVWGLRDPGKEVTQQRGPRDCFEGLVAGLIGNLLSRALAVYFDGLCIFGGRVGKPTPARPSWPLHRVSPNDSFLTLFCPL